MHVIQTSQHLNTRDAQALPNWHRDATYVQSTASKPVGTQTLAVLCMSFILSTMHMTAAAESNLLSNTRL